MFANNDRECFGLFNSSLFEFLTFNKQIFGTFINLWRLAGVAGLEPSTLGGYRECSATVLPHPSSLALRFTEENYQNLIIMCAGKAEARESLLKAKTQYV